MRNYSDLLPSYLDGENIRRHSSLIERSDRYLDGLVELFGLWDKLERPILIKREQPTDAPLNEVTIYINTPTPITEIIIEGDIGETIIPEDTVTTTYEGTWVIDDPYIEVNSGSRSYPHPIFLPQLTVTVNTETHTYTKKYPENDTIENNSADHDIFLDIVGGLLGVPRRKYMKWEGAISTTEPPRFAKQAEGHSHYFLECTEDDYYYKERLEYFINTHDNLRLFHAIYDKDAILLQNEDFGISGVSSPANVIFSFINKNWSPETDNKKNIDTTDVQTIAEQTLPLTRQTIVLPYTKLLITGGTRELYVNKHKLTMELSLEKNAIDVTLADSHYVPLSKLPVKVSYDSDNMYIGTFLTDENGIVHINIDGGRAGQQTIRYELTKEYPYFDTTPFPIVAERNISLFKLSLSDGAWQYKKLADTTVTGFEPASMLSNGNLNCGGGMLAYTPAINPELVDLTDYTLHIVFHHTNNGQQIRLGTLRETEETAQLQNVLTVRPRQYETVNQAITATHTVDYKFVDGVCHAYFDGEDTGLSKDYSNITDMIYIGGYNSTSNSETRGLHFEEISVNNIMEE